MRRKEEGIGENRKEAQEQQGWKRRKKKEEGVGKRNIEGGGNRS